VRQKAVALRAISFVTVLRGEAGIMAQTWRKCKSRPMSGDYVPDRAQTPDARRAPMPSGLDRRQRDRAIMAGSAPGGGLRNGQPGYA